MRNLQNFFDLSRTLIKKKFFNGLNNDICHDYTITIEINGVPKEDIPDNETEEYVKNYNSTTRWQTV